MNLFIIKNLKYYFLLIALSLGSFCRSQNNSYTLNGQVVNEFNLGLDSIQVNLLELDLSAVTNSKGLFYFKNIPLGNHTLTINSNNGYASLTQKVIIDKKHTSSVLKLERLEKLQDVNIVALKKQALKEMGYEVSVIDLKEEKHTTKTLNDILNQVSSVNVRQSGGLGAKVNYSINGLSDNSVRFFIDGIPMEYYGSSFSINTIPTSVIDKIEIYKGITPVYLSNDNLGGAINLVTKKTKNNVVNASYSYGSFNTHISSIYAHLENKKKGVYFDGFGFYNYADNNYTVWGDNIILRDAETYEITRNNRVSKFHDAFESKGLKTSVGLKNKKWTDKLELGFIYADLNKEIQHGTTMEIPFGEAVYKQNLHTTYFEFVNTKLFDEKFKIQFYTSYNHLKRVFVDTTKNIYDWKGTVIGERTIGGELNSSPTLNTLKQKTYLQKLNLDYKISKKHTAYFTWQSAFIGREEADPTIANPNEAYFLPQNFNKNALGLSLNSKWLNRKIKTSFFLKNHFYSAAIKTTDDGQTFTSSKTGANLLGIGFSAKYKFTQLLALKTSFEKANRLPEEEEVLGNGVSILSTSDLEPEQSYNFNIGVEQQFNFTSESLFTYEVTFFKKKVDNLIRLWADGDSVSKYINFQKVDIVGFDTALKYSWKNKFKASFTLSKLNPVIKNEYDSDGNINLLNNTVLANTLLFKNTFNTSTKFKNTFQNNDILTLNTSSMFVDSFFVNDTVFGANNKNELPQQISHNLGINYLFSNQKTSLSLDCNNIFDAQLFDNFAIQKQGRAFYFKINWKII